jgi:hypothetical protein
MYPYWRRREDLDGEICSIMGRSDLAVYEDSPHSCIHIMMGDYEFTSALFPLDDSIRNDLRQQAFLLQNGTNEDEVARIRDANKKLQQYDELQRGEALASNREFGVWEYEHRFLGREVKPMIIVPGGRDDS